MKKCLYEEFDFYGKGFALFELFSDERHAFFLDSSLYENQRGRHSFIGFDPFEVFQREGKTTLVSLKERFSIFSLYQREEFTPLSCGIVGFLGYEYGLYQENIALKSKEGLGLPEVMFGFYDCILTVDHRDKKLYVTSSGLPEHKEAARQKRARERLDYIVEKINLMDRDSKISESSEVPAPTRVSKFGSNFSRRPSENEIFVQNKERDEKNTGGVHMYVEDFFESCNAGRDEKIVLREPPREEYCRVVDKALDYIAQGDIYQVNLSQRFSFDLNGRDVDARQIYQSLRELSPSSFASYFDGGAFQIMSSSPERFVQVQKNVARARPMKGTRPRGRDANQDEKLKKEIVNSAKDKAELLMITDLLRNDLGRVCEYGSVRVKEMRVIEEYTTVFQATSTVQGVLRENKDCFDVLEVCFPGGSITGCPKIRAMEIIEELEPFRRGVYTGSLGYISFSGDMDFNILIRTLLAYQGKLYFHVGGGIVADSTPEGEYEETLVKAKAIKECLGEFK